MTLARFARIFALAFALLGTSKAFGLAAFALRENAPCTMCHTNGSAPHLTKYGFMYRRAGYRNPSDIGNVEKDLKAMDLTKHMAVGVNVDYSYATNKALGSDKTLETDNEIGVRELEIWPFVGAILGNVGVFSEIDASPSTATPGAGTPPSAGGTNLGHLELSYTRGTKDLFFNFRSGYMTTQGYGAGDQWLDDGNLPFIDTLTAQYNEDTLVLPLGAMGVPQMGAEVGVTYGLNTFLTVGTFNGFDGTSGQATNTQSVLTPIGFNKQVKGTKDFKGQIDQFFSTGTEVSLIYYRGEIPLLDPTNVGFWENHYNTQRIYLTQSVAPAVDLLAGASTGTYEFIAPLPDTTHGQFTSRGAFFGSNYYAAQHLTLSARYDYFEYSKYQDSTQKAVGGALMVGVPVDNTLVNFHYNLRNSAVDGVTKDFRAEWRLIF